MYRISEIRIKRFRSITDIRIKVSGDRNMITFCGANNVGKTNVLRSINLFFNPESFVPEEDIPSHKYYGSRGGTIWPEITITFSAEADSQTIITRKFTSNDNFDTFGDKIEGKTKTKLSNKELDDVFNSIAFYYIESINISMPRVIDDLVELVFDTEYQDATFRGSNRVLKDAYENYIAGLKHVLNKLENEINPMFEQYKEQWGISFDIMSNVTKFRELISNEVEFFINDKSNNLIESKGSGLQRLAYLLLHFRLIDKITNKSIILLVDEPDVYLHEGMQVKLLNDFNKLLDKCQIYITTHSKIFIDMNSMVNVHLLDLEIEEKFYSRRKNKEFYSLKTILVSTDSDEGSRKIRNHLGLVKEIDDILQPYNIMVEGESDLNYLVGYFKYFGYSAPNIISANGADNIEKYLEYYDSFYKNSERVYSIRVLLDNDPKGRDVYRKLIKKNYKNLNVKIEFTPTHDGKIPNTLKLENEKSNWEIEDFIYPEVLVHLVNIILKRKPLKPINVTKILSQLQSQALKSKGILEIIDYEKNTINPTDGSSIQFCTSGHSTETIKNSISKLFETEGNLKIAQILNDSHKKYPEVKVFIDNISKNNFS